MSSSPLTSTEAQAIASWHLNAVRIPLNEDCWLGINGVDPALSGVYYQEAIKEWVAALNSAGLVAILDLHFAAPGGYLASSQWPMADEDHAPTFWSQVATDFASVPGVIFDLFNEPYLGGVHPTLTDWSCWLNGCLNTTPLSTAQESGTLVQYQTAGMQQLVSVVRATGARQPIMVGGLYWSGDPCQLPASGPPFGTCPEKAFLPSDPLHQLILDFHTYLPNSACQSLQCWDAVAAGAQKADIPIVTGELGEKDCSASYMDSYMSWADQHSVSYLAWNWGVGKSPSCQVGTGTSNHNLLQNWNGQPSTTSPDGAAYQGHIGALYGEHLKKAAKQTSL